MGTVCCEDSARTQGLPAAEGRPSGVIGGGLQGGAAQPWLQQARALLTQDQHHLNGSFYF